MLVLGEERVFWGRKIGGDLGIYDYYHCSRRQKEKNKVAGCLAQWDVGNYVMRQSRRFSRPNSRWEDG